MGWSAVSAGRGRDHRGGLQPETRGGQPGADLRGSPVEGSDAVGAVRMGVAGRAASPGGAELVLPRPEQLPGGDAG